MRHKSLHNSDVPHENKMKTKGAKRRRATPTRMHVHTERVYIANFCAHLINNMTLLAAGCKMIWKEQINGLILFATTTSVVVIVMTTSPATLIATTVALGR